MKKRVPIFFVVVFFLFSFITEVKCQSFDKKPNSEVVNIFTDRGIYVSGENIQFVATVFLKKQDVNNKKRRGKEDSNIDIEYSDAISGVIYLEIISPIGERVTGGKFLISNSISKGCIGIPTDAKNGLYYLRAYTKYMRNFGNECYGYVQIKIVNPLDGKIVNYEPEKSNVEGLRDSIVASSSVDDNVLILNKRQYGFRDSVSVKLDECFINSDEFTNVNLSVIPKVSESHNFQVSFKQVSTKTFDRYFYPEYYGISLTGILLDGKSNTTIPQAPVKLSILGDYKEMVERVSDSLGQFYFQLPNIYGTRNLFLSSESSIDLNAAIKIDNDFCTLPISISTPMVTLTEGEKQVTLDFAQNNQVRRYFGKKNEVKDVGQTFDTPFYGTPTTDLVLDNYISLPTLEDYINELIPTLKVRTSKGRKSFKILSNQVETNLYQPLVLLDMVAIDSVESILSISPQRISHIEIINTRYIKGNAIYGGIISFFSRKNDFAGMNLPSSGVFLDYDFLKNCEECGISEKIAPNEPDTRNTLYWNPSLKIDSNNVNTINFKTSDASGEYIVLLRGVTEGGNVFSYKKSFIVQP